MGHCAIQIKTNLGSVKDKCFCETFKRELHVLNTPFSYTWGVGRAKNHNDEIISHSPTLLVQLCDYFHESKFKLCYYKWIGKNKSLVIIYDIYDTLGNSYKFLLICLDSYGKYCCLDMLIKGGAIGGQKIKAELALRLSLCMHLSLLQYLTS